MSFASVTAVRRAASLGTLPERVTTFSFCTVISIGAAADGFVPMEPAVDAALHAELVDRLAEVGPRLAKLIADVREPAIDRFANALADARLIRGGWLVVTVVSAASDCNVTKPMMARDRSAHGFAPREFC